MVQRALLALAVAACGGGGSTNIEATLRFADLTDAEISRLVAAASGTEGFQAQGQLMSFDDPDPDPCPAIAVDSGASRVDITGGCTTGDGERIDGGGTITNPFGWGDAELEYDFSDDTVYVAAQLVIERSSFRTAFDGTVRIGSGYEVIDMDLVAEQLGVAVRSDIYMDCDRDGCSIGNSGVELVGVGGARVSGSIGVAGTRATGDFTLRGADTVDVTIANNCVTWELAGTDRRFTCR